MVHLAALIRRPRWLLALALAGGLMHAAPAHAQQEDDGGGPAGPVALDSPAWRDLMALPLAEGGKLNHHAARLPGLWGRPVEGEAMRDQLLLQHGRALAGGPPTGTLADLAGQPRPTRDAIQAGWNAGLQVAWGEIAWQDTPAIGLPEAALGPAVQPGLWRLRAGGIGAHAWLRNRARVAIALPGALELELESDGAPRVVMSCAPVSGSRIWWQDDTARLWCTSANSAAAAAWPALARAAPRWRMALPEDDARWAAWVKALAGEVPIAVGALSRARGHCRDQFNCRDGRLPTSDELRQTRQREQLAHDEKSAREDNTRQIRHERSLVLWLAAGALAGFGVYVLVARVVGMIVASGLVMALTVGACMWILKTSRMQGFGGLGVLGGVAGVLQVGVALALVYALIYREVFARRKA